MDFGIQGKRALVCASSKGLGKAIAKALAKEGVRVFMCARDAKTLIDAADEVGQVAVEPVTAMTCDLATEEGREMLISQVRGAFGELDILVHNVGGPKPCKVQTSTLRDWQTGFDQLFQSVFQLNEAFVPDMKKNRWGRILCVTSLSAFEPINDLAVSNGLRPAITAMLKTLADEVAGDNITINCLAPGMIMTDRTEERIRDYLDRNPQSNREEWLAQYVKSIPAGRLGEPDEFGAAAAFLCSQQASYITGSTLCIDGGKRRSYH
ncbi:MAG: putative oxidoreductase [Vampirovibrio sp.]|jgi:3-oxoacyl-[acyl-carrier protein] reductase|nr:putative oxidoreductase [Vampirovibrio sp.]